MIHLFVYNMSENSLKKNITSQGPKIPCLSVSRKFWKAKIRGLEDVCFCVIIDQNDWAIINIIAGQRKYQKISKLQDHLKLKQNKKSVQCVHHSTTSVLTASQQKASSLHKADPTQANVKFSN